MGSFTIPDGADTEVRREGKCARDQGPGTRAEGMPHVPVKDSK